MLDQDAGRPRLELRLGCADDVRVLCSVSGVQLDIIRGPVPTDHALARADMVPECSTLAMRPKPDALKGSLRADPRSRRRKHADTTRFYEDGCRRCRSGNAWD